MVDRYLDPTATDNTGSGGPASPKKTLAGITIASGDRTFIKRGTTYSDALNLAAGTITTHTVFAAYANPDGTDNPDLPAPIILRTTALSTYGSTNKDYCDIFDLDFRGDLTVANDAAMLFAGEGSTYRNVRIDTNVGALACWNKSNVLLENCELNGVSHGSGNNNNVVTISADNRNIDSITLDKVRINHKGGGGTSSHYLRAETSSTNYDLTNLVLRDVSRYAPGGELRNPNTATIGLRLARCPAAKIIRPKFNGVLTGIYVNGGGKMITGVEITDDDIESPNFDDCYHFGVHLTTHTRDFIIRGIRAWRPGSDMGPSWYGRGFEASGQAGDKLCGGHWVDQCSFCFAKNYGGPSDNGSEGVGASADDGTDSIRMTNTVLAFNEGNGWQQFGGTGTTTGGHFISGCYFEGNGLTAWRNRRSGGTQLTPFVAHVGFAGHKGDLSYLVNNVFVGGIAGVSENATSEDILVKANNIMIDVQYPFMMPPSFARKPLNNVMFNPTVSAQLYSGIAVDANGTPTFPALDFAGENDYRFDPRLDAMYRPLAGSPVIGAGAFIGEYNDADGMAFKRPPSIGRYEDFTTGRVYPDFDDDDDACSILVPVDIVNTAGVLKSVRAGGAELAEDTNPAWDSGKTYVAGERVYLLSTHRVYESTGASGNAGKDPSNVANQFNAAGVATFWIDIGPTNRAAMFDGQITTQTSMASPAVITLTPGAFNGFALFGIDADSFSVTVRDQPGGTVVYSEPTTPLEGSMPADYYEYFFDKFKPLRQFIRSGIEPYSSSEITLTLNKGTGPVKLGMFAIGDLRPMGLPQRDATVTPEDFSYLKQDAYGNAVVRKRPNATSMTISCVMPIEDANTVLDTVKEVLGVPCVVVGSEKRMYEWLTVFGLISASQSAVPYPDCTIKLSVKGFI